LLRDAISDRISFLHTADLHLDSPLGLVDRARSDLNERIYSATFKAFENAIQLAADQKVDFFLLAGDAFDQTYSNLAAQLSIKKGFERLSDCGIGAYVAFGNHDPSGEWLKHLRWPESVRFLRSDEPQTIITDKARIVGMSHAKTDIRDNLAAKFPKRDGDLFTIGILHCNVGGDREHDPYAPCDLRDLSLDRADYWALGHIHKHKVLCQCEPVVIYAGNPQGRNAKESGARGCYLVEAVGGTITPEHVPLDVVRHAELSVSIDGMETLDDFVEASVGRCRAAAFEASGRDLICRLSATGSGSLGDRLLRPADIQTALEEVREATRHDEPRIWPLRLEVKAGLPVDRNTLAQADTFLGMLLQLSEVRQGSDEGLERIRELVAPLYNRARDISVLSESEIGDLYRAAEEQCIRLLRETTE
jgi:exonuclease SbcD